MPPVIEVSNLTKRFGDMTAVDGISFQVAPGECFALLGPNGAGKTTTIKMLITLLSPDAGEARVNGYSLRQDPAHIRASIGYVSQSVSVDGSLTGRENLTIFGKLYGLNRRELSERVPQILSLMDLEDAADRPVAHYSGGMVRRLEIGQAILHRPAVVFLDEPTVGLDPLARQALWTHIQSLQKNYGTTLFLTTHFMDEAQELCHRVAIMNKGSIRVIGTLAELRRKAKRPKADMDELFIHFVGPVALDEKGDLSDVKRVRRTARRLG